MKASDKEVAMKETAIDRDGKWDRLSHLGGLMWDSVVKDKEDVVGSGGEGKKTTRAICSKNHLNVK